MDTINAGKALHRAFSVFLFNSKYELLLQVCHLITILRLTNGCWKWNCGRLEIIGCDFETLT